MSSSQQHRSQSAANQLQQQHQSQKASTSRSSLSGANLIDEEEEEDRMQHHHQSLDPYNKPEISHKYKSHYMPANDDDDDDEDEEEEEDLELQQQQYAYDSMSTILEVDSEASDESAEMLQQQQQQQQQRRARNLLLESPLMVRTQPTPEPAIIGRSGNSRRSSPDTSEEGRVSPVGPDKFSGALSALAQQVERLRRSASPSSRQLPPSSRWIGGSGIVAPEEATKTTSGGSTWPSQRSQLDKQAKCSDASNSSGGDDEHLSVSDTTKNSGDSDSEMNQNNFNISPKPASSSGSNNVIRGEFSSPDFLNKQHDLKQSDANMHHGSNRLGIRPNSRAASAESLMMITVSPMASPRVKFPILRTRQRNSQVGDHYGDGDGDDYDQRRLVEVSNKSTITAIDLTLMDKMVQKYFVDTSEKATQSIKFDCDESELDTRRPISGSTTTTTSNRQKPTSKSVAVGTEKFSRERFSLLPPTTTRSTQTKPNINDMDLGTSETRRYKLSHQLFGPVIRRNHQSTTSKELVSSNSNSNMESESLEAGSELLNKGNASSSTSAISSTATSADNSVAATEDTLDAKMVDHDLNNDNNNSELRVTAEADSGNIKIISPSKVAPTEPKVKHNLPSQYKPQHREQHQQTSPQPEQELLGNQKTSQSPLNQQHRAQVTTRETGTSMPEFDRPDKSPIRKQLISSPTPTATPLESPRAQLKRLLTSTRLVKSATPTERDSLVGSPEIMMKERNQQIQFRSQVKTTGEKPEASSDSLSSSREQVTNPKVQQTGSSSSKVISKTADSIQQDESSSSSSSSSSSVSETSGSSSQSDSLLQKASQETSPMKLTNNKEITSAIARGSPDNNKALATSGSNPGQPIEAAAPTSRATIPSLKTELRVIIEFNDSRQRQRSEVTSNSHFLEGKLSKKTEVSTSKQVAASPREVLSKLQSIGREHSLLYQQNSRAATTTPPAAVAAANQNALRSLSMSSLPRGLGEGEDETATSGGWREVSRSSVRNEIETDTRSKHSRRRQRARQQQQHHHQTNKVNESIDEDIVMTSDATINHTANDKSAIELRSRAVRRRESLERDPRTGQMVRSGRISEQTLVESEAGFDENEADRQQRELERQRQQQQRTRKDQPEVVPEQATGVKGTATQNYRPLDSTNLRNLRQASVTPSPIPPTYSTPDVRREAEGAPAAEVASRRSAPTPSPVAAASVSPTRGYRTARIEIDEEREDRRQITKNGQLVFDDRLRERKYETQRGGSPMTEAQHQQKWALPTSPLVHSPTTLQFNRKTLSSPGNIHHQQNPIGRSASTSPRSPQLLSPTSPPGILRQHSSRAHQMQQQQQQNQRQQQRQLLKPISLRATPTAEQAPTSGQPILFADQTSNLSQSDPETMDSGFAQSGVGSGSALNQLPQRPTLASGRPSPATGGGGGSISYQRQNHQQQSQRRSHDSVGAISPQDGSYQHYGRTGAQRRRMEEEQQTELEQPESLNFVDDDVDELIDQLDNSRATSRLPQTTTLASSARQAVTTTTPQANMERRSLGRATSSPQATDMATSDDSRFLIAPPPAFCSSEPALNKLLDNNNWIHGKQAQQQTTTRTTPKDTTIRAKAPPKAAAAAAAVIHDNKDTALTTKLTRSKRATAPPEVQSAKGAAGTTVIKGSKRTLTKLEQSLVTPEQLNGNSNYEQQRQQKRQPDGQTINNNGHQNRMCRFKAQVMFESDTDSMSTERHSVASSRGGGQKELVSETKFSRGGGGPAYGSGLMGAGETNGSGSGEARPGEAQIFGASQGPKWDYSLRVNRMRGNRVDSKVNTYIKHSRQPLINSEAS